MNQNEQLFLIATPCLGKKAQNIGGVYSLII